MPQRRWTVLIRIILVIPQAFVLLAVGDESAVYRQAGGWRLVASDGAKALLVVFLLLGAYLEFVRIDSATGTTSTTSSSASVLALAADGGDGARAPCRSTAAGEHVVPRRCGGSLVEHGDASA